MHALAFLIAYQHVINSQFVCVYLSGRCQSTTVWRSMLVLNAEVCMLLLLWNFTKLNLTA